MRVKADPPVGGLWSKFGHRAGSCIGSSVDALDWKSRGGGGGYSSVDVCVFSMREVQSPIPPLKKRREIGNHKRQGSWLLVSFTEPTAF